MQELTLPFLLDVLSRGSVTIALITMFWFLYTERLVPRGRLEDCERERDRLLAEEVAGRERAEARLATVSAEKQRVIDDRDRLRRRLEGQGRQT